MLTNEAQMGSSSVPPGQPVDREAVVQSFLTWARDVRQLELTPGEIEMATGALEEIVTLTPKLLMQWSVGNQYRFRKLREIERRRVRNEIVHFIHALGAGTVVVE